MTQPLDVVILAAGQGKRMRSALPKVLHSLAGRPLLRHVIDTAREFADARLHVVIGHGAEQVREALADVEAEWVLQVEQLGTGHAVQHASEGLADGGISLILYGDVPLIRHATLTPLLHVASEGGVAVLTARLDDPTGYGRIVRDAEGRVRAIVEQRDADAEQLSIREINTGIMALPNARLRGWLDRLDNDNAQGEYYLTDVIEMAVRERVEVQACLVDDEHEVAGVNSRRQLAELERQYQHREAGRLMDEGVSFADPGRFDLRGRLEHDGDLFVDVNVVIEGTVRAGRDVVIGPGAVLRNIEIGAGSVIQPHCVIEDSTIGANCQIGPFARLRPGTALADGAKIGNFVETKNAQVGPGSKINHLSYVGDAELGSKVNVGAGTITCNYDGANKHRTEIRDEAFIGSNTALVAPVTVGERATVGAGSVVTSDVPDDTLAVARGKQRLVEGWQRPVKKHK
jgi:bifunctional UDP-N-acetylglucosamine pyrophosphorylase/glucosamine-1-phosphate N-acetyltransferase